MNQLHNQWFKELSGHLVKTFKFINSSVDIIITHLQTKHLFENRLWESIRSYCKTYKNYYCN